MTIGDSKLSLIINIHLINLNEDITFLQLEFFQMQIENSSFHHRFYSIFVSMFQLSHHSIYGLTLGWTVAYFDYKLQ